MSLNLNLGRVMAWLEPASLQKEDNTSGEWLVISPGDKNKEQENKNI